MLAIEGGSVSLSVADTPLSGHGYLHNLPDPDKSPCGERACPALGCEAAPKPASTECLIHRDLVDWGCCAAQRGTSPLTTTALSAALLALSQRCVGTYGHRGQAPSHIYAPQKSAAFSPNRLILLYRPPRDTFSRRAVRRMLPPVLLRAATMACISWLLRSWAGCGS